MQTLISLLTHFAVVAAVMLLYYFVPVIPFYYEFYVRNKNKWQPFKIQKKQPGNGQMRREIKSSLGASIIFSLAALLMYECAIRGYTKVYFDIHEYSLLYFGISYILNVFANDTIFYWAHRFMHLKWVFPYVHLEHHKSTTPTPFGVLAFHPLEAIVHSMAYILLIFIIPIHPIMFGIFHGYNLLSNVAGHSGYELMPEKMRRHWFFNWQNTVTNHDDHHKKFNCNYGNYFLIWDMLMNTLDKKQTTKDKAEKEAVGSNLV
jgi:lathosterol oxidase